ncbi:RHTO0S01e13322g1_1 [Rhodotorula toruloides]|uniref:RHTO0S01e13322g1_1 n=2 Tax=Rhodotorula toruloides TaxID=5286 RepID=A0A061AL64_RHOTO|nr:RHTO0S01e13322g1_1 [Rhodotorula toruloides]
MFMDEESQETHEFSGLFTDRALLKAQFSREGTGVWGAEVTERPFIAYIEGIRVEPEYRGQGVGRWALERLLEVKDPYFGTVDFIFAWPTPHPKDAPKRDDPNREQIWDTQTARAVKTFQCAGYRRVGTTAFFCLARDPNHPSRRIALEQDAQYSKNVTMNQDQLVKMLALGQLPW